MIIKSVDQDQRNLGTCKSWGGINSFPVASSGLKDERVLNKVKVINAIPAAINTDTNDKCRVANVINPVIPFFPSILRGFKKKIVNF